MNSQGIIEKLSKNAVKYTFFILAALTLVTIVVRLLTPSTPTVVVSEPSPTPTTDDPLTFMNLRAGQKVDAQTLYQLGEVLESTSSASEKKISLKSVFPTKPNVVVANTEDEIQFIEENILSTENTEYVATYITQFGKPNLTLYNPKIGMSVRSYVFLNAGLVVTAHIRDGSIEQKWYFKPTSQLQFMNTYGKQLSEQPLDEPESFE